MSTRSRHCEEGAELGGDRVRLGVELAPGDPDDAVAHGLEMAVTGAVALERLAGGVDRVAVELDDEAFGGPDGVGLVGPEGRVRPRAGEPVGFGEGEEAAFELAVRDRLAGLPLLVEGALDRGDPPTIGVARDEGIEGKRAREAADLRLVEGVLELLLRYDPGEVEERAGDVRDRNAAAPGSLRRVGGRSGRPEARGARGAGAARSLPHGSVRCGGFPRAPLPSGG
jgi:hypothetical protein